MQLANTATLCGSRSAFTELCFQSVAMIILPYAMTSFMTYLFCLHLLERIRVKTEPEIADEHGRIPTRQGDKRSNHKSQNTDAQGTRAPTTTLYVLCGLQEGVRLYLP